MDNGTFKAAPLFSTAPVSKSCALLFSSYGPRTDDPLPRPTAWDFPAVKLPPHFCNLTFGALAIIKNDNVPTAKFDSRLLGWAF